MKEYLIADIASVLPDPSSVEPDHSINGLVVLFKAPHGFKLKTDRGKILVLTLLVGQQSGIMYWYHKHTTRRSLFLDATFGPGAAKP